ncbi:MAG: hypothetical protein K9L68_00645 [Spirochaetales bacterium]|nr:hypothetical protein [Spirochaetales bacterium]MCF7937084.1 hypothetical protein [Spirochaetales bacterium]
MQRNIIFLLVLLFLASSLAAETVMVSLHTGEQPSRTPTSYLIALEEGIMEVFFQEGHIVFNSVPDSGSMPKGEVEGELYSVAGGGGAGFLITAELQVKTPSPEEREKSDEENRPLPVSARFQLARVLPRRLIETGIIEFDRQEKSEQLTPRDMCFQLGNEIAYRAIQKW